jgi:hypothetical protein
MMVDYTDVVSLSREEFMRSAPSADDLRDPSKFTESDDEDIARMERLLDVKEGALAGDNYFLQRSVCVCGRLLTMYDFVFTGLVDAGHSKSLIVHTFSGNKYILNAPRPVRCSQSAHINPASSYSMQGYGCWQGQ